MSVDGINLEVCKSFGSGFAQIDPLVTLRVGLLTSGHCYMRLPCAIQGADEPECAHPGTSKLACNNMRCLGQQLYL